MADVFNEALRGWQNFYFMMGGAAAGLIGLMFVALSLGINLASTATREDMKLFVTPSVIYFVSVLLISCVLLVPGFSPPALALILALGGGVGFVQTVPFAKRLFHVAQRHQDFILSDWLSQVIVPVASYLLLVAAGVCFAATQWSIGFLAVWVADILLLLCAITNTWSLVVWIVEQKQ